jgi:hypothetical protein
MWRIYTFPFEICRHSKPEYSRERRSDEGQALALTWGLASCPFDGEIVSEKTTDFVKPVALFETPRAKGLLCVDTIGSVAVWNEIGFLWRSIKGATVGQTLWWRLG